MAAPVPASIANCHAVGLDSIVLQDRISPERGMVRVFVARPEHTLYRNHAALPEYAEGMSIGLHAHHCDVLMVPLFGHVENVLEAYDGGPHAAAPPAGQWVSALYPFIHSSRINGGDGFVRSGMTPWTFRLRSERLRGALALPAEARHTVFVPEGEAAAWMIVEGRESLAPDNVTWTNADLTAPPPEGLYSPMTESRLIEDYDLLAANGVRLW